MDIRPPVLVLSPEERAFLDKYWYWLDRLESGLLLPSTERQRQFLAVIRGEAPAKYPNEHLWLRVKAARKIQQTFQDALRERDRLAGELSARDAVIANLRAKIDRQNAIVESQNHMIAGMRSIIAEIDPSRLETVPATRSSDSIMCRQCRGDGGGGRCPRCGGNGIEPTRP